MPSEEKHPKDGAPAQAESFSAQGLSALLEHLEREPGRDQARAFDRLLRPGAVIGRFELLREVGSGAFGVVFEARDTALGRSVAFKAIRPGRRTARLDELLLREAESAARLQHENIVALYDFGRGETGPYLVLELLRGETLAARLARGPMEAGEAVRVGAQVARALAHAHAAGLLHRDLKPSNVFLTGAGGVKVLDLGLAHLFGADTGISGTPAYMAPEQWRGEAQDGRTDVFALGVMLFEMLAGQRPYALHEDRSTALDPGPEPRLEVPRLPGRLVRLVERCIAKDPPRRPPSARAVLEELLAVERAAAAVGGRRPRRALVAALGVAALTAGAAVAWRLVARPSLDRVSVAVADFDDRTGQAGLEGLSSLLITSLEQSQRLEVLPRSRLRDLLRRAGHTAVERIDETLGREAGKAAGARALLLSTLHRFGQVYALELRAVEPASDRTLFALKEQGRGQESLPELLDRVAEGVRLALREPRREIDERSVRLAQAVTPDLEAWRHYFHGTECFERLMFAGGYGECLADFQKAIERDPDFTLAHFQISYLLFWQGRPRVEQRAALAPALRNAERAPPKERRLIEAWAAFLDGDDARAKALLREATAASPDDKLVWYLAGEVPFHRDELAESIAFFRRAHELDPAWFMPAQHLVYALGSAGDLAEVRRVVAGLEALGARPGPLVGLCYARLWLEPERALPDCDRAIDAGAGVAGNEFRAIALLDRGAYRELEAQLARMRDPSGERGFDWHMQLVLRGQQGRWPEVFRMVKEAGDPDDAWFQSLYAEELVGLGDRERAWRAAERMAKLDPYLASNLAVHLAWLGDLDHAAALSPNLPAGSPRVAAYQAVVRWRRGDLAGAIEALRPVAAQTPLSIDPAIPFPLFLLGDALAEAGRDAEAVDALRRLVAMPLHYPSWTYPRALYLLARSEERLGERDRARERIGALLRLWKDADPSQPLLADARALGARLGVR